MSGRERVQELISYVEQGRILEAMDEFYAESVVMQDNNNPPIVGKAANIEREKGFVGMVSEVHENKARSFAVDGDHAAIHWVFDFTGNDGKRLRFDQIAYQTWQRSR